MATPTKLIIANHALRIIGAASITTFGETTTEEGRAINDVYEDMRDEVLSEHPWTFAMKRAKLAKEMTAATQASPVVVTVASHGYSNGDSVKITGVIGMTELNGNTYKVANQATNTFELTDPDDDSNIDGTAFTEYDSEGFTRKIQTLAWDEDDLDVVYDLPSDYIKLFFTSDPWARVKIEINKIVTNVEELKISYVYQLDDPTIYSAKFRVALAYRIAAELAFSLTESVSKSKALLEEYQVIKLTEAQSSDSQQGTPEEGQQNLWEFARLGGVGSGITGRPNDSTWHPVNWWY
jgi:hypothetical protein